MIILTGWCLILILLLVQILCVTWVLLLISIYPGLNTLMLLGINLLRVLVCYMLYTIIYRLSVYYLFIMPFVMPYLTYCIELWGNACTTYLNPIQLLQKKCIRYICNAQCLAHCKPLAKSMHALLFKDLYTLSVASLMYKAFHNRIISSNLFVKLLQFMSILGILI